MKDGNGEKYYDGMPIAPHKLLEIYATSMTLSDEDKVGVVYSSIIEWTQFYNKRGRTIADICPMVLKMVRLCDVADRISEASVNRIVAYEWHRNNSHYGSREQAMRESRLFGEYAFSEAFSQTERSWNEQGQLFHFGIDELDAGIGGGVGEGELLSIIGNPGSMKTSLLLNGIQNWIMEGGKDAAFFSLDMGRVPIIERMLARAMNCTPAAVRVLASGGAESYSRAKAVLSREYEGKLAILENTLEISWNVPSVIEYMERKAPRLVCIDYLTLLKEGIQSDYEIANLATTELLKTAKGYGCTLVLLSQMSMESQRLQAQGGMCGSARGGGYINERSDVEIELFKDTGVDEYGHDTGAEIIATVKKSRKNGACASFRLDYMGEQMRFKSTASRTARVKKRQKIFGHADCSWHTKSEND